jgi:hypothetical protein
MRRISFFHSFSKPSHIRLVDRLQNPMKFRLRSLVPLFIFTFALAACETTHHSANSRAVGERAKLIDDVCTLINASGGGVEWVSAQKSNSSGRGEVRISKNRYSTHANADGQRAIRLQVKEINEQLVKYIPPSASLPPEHRASSIKVDKWTLPINAITVVQVLEVDQRKSPFNVTRSNYLGGYVAANEVAKNCFFVHTSLSQKVRHDVRHSDPGQSWSRSFAGGAVAYFDSREEADRLAEKLRQLSNTVPPR